MRNILSFIIGRIRSKKRFYSALFLSTLSGVSYQGLNFLALIVVTRMLGAEKMGDFSLIQSGVVLLITLSIIGQNISATTLTSRYLVKSRNKLGTLIGNSYLLTLSSTAVVTILMATMPDLVFSDSLSGSIPRHLGILLFSLWFIGMTIDMVQVSTLVGFEAYKDILRTDIAKGLIALSLVVLLSFRWGLTGTIAGYVLSSWTGVILNQYYLRRNLKQIGISIDYSPSRQIISEILKIGFPVSLAGLLVSTGIWLTNRLVIDLENGAVALGIAFVCRQILVFMQFLPNQISKVLLPIVSGSKSEHDDTIMKRTSIMLVTIISLGLTLAGYLFEDLIVAVYRLDPELSRWPLRIMVFSLLFSSYNSIMGQIVFAQSKPWLRTMADLVLSATMILTVVFLPPSMVFIIVPLAFLLSYILSNASLIAVMNSRWFYHDSGSIKQY